MTVPDELQDAPPRKVSLSSTGWVSLASLFLVAPVTIAILMRGAVWNLRHVDYLPLGLVAVSLGAGLLATLRGFAATWRQSRLLMSGCAAVATVTADVTPWWYRFRKHTRQPYRRIQCEFPNRHGKVCTVALEIRSAHIPGMELIVIYDAGEPQKAFKYPAPWLKILRN